MNANPNDPQLPGERRRDRIADLVGRRGFVRTAELAREFRLSEVTIRTDLESLAADGLLSRVHGGALSLDRPVVERPFEEESSIGIEAKRAIGVAAASLVRSGDCVVLDVGTTTTQIALALLERHDLEGVVVVTNGLTIALALEQAVPRFTVIVSGGTLRPLQHSLVNPLATSVFSSITADVAFIGCTGVDVAHGATNVNLPETDLKRLMTQTARRSYLVADGAKLSDAHLGVIAPLATFEALITAGADPAHVDELRAAGLAVVEADDIDATGLGEVGGGEAGHARDDADADADADAVAGDDTETDAATVGVDRTRGDHR
ncbi:DeoR/GlpR family DNA-binding transcription regulator [Frigoribacterium faeni]|uniref:Transcriptional regulator n=1 Tax=Frigoribacterium faeni TaxID=145483 RepID=A0A7W3JJC8_9MICO|nr:DeoR/GlpR family DNA-binding transcription regulator [Frigoribacterium faeni]MBA8813936.1 DeoR family transcriptional regulator of aga operon [Frigoribacterium faeni]GEK82089.1 transcriptional regulator [Frigoribacterium faeni]